MLVPAFSARGLWVALALDYKLETGRPWRHCTLNTVPDILSSSPHLSAAQSLASASLWREPSDRRGKLGPETTKNAEEL